MSRVADHTALAELATGGQYLRAITAHYQSLRKVIIIPLPSLTAAIAASGANTKPIERYLSNTATVKLASYSAQDALTIGQHRPGPRPGQDVGDWLLTAAACDAARWSGLPILTHDPARYDGHDVTVTRLP